MTGPGHDPMLILCLLLFIAAQSVFAMVPAIDLAVSGLFADGTAGFGWADGTAPFVNLLIRRAGETVALLAVVLCALGAVTGRLRLGALRLWAYIPLCVLLSTGLSNLLFKAHFGRARPQSLVEFGGTAEFSPAWQIADQCARNCSFTSGEVALAAGLAIPATVILWPRLLSLRSRAVALLLAGGYVVVVALFRIGLGRHFLSDAVFAALIAACAALALYRLLRIGEALREAPPPLLAAPLRQWLAELRGRKIRAQDEAA
jgi:membrane-associated PAP2 superfamily phosphatase